MTQIDEFRTFLLRRRKWPLVLACAAVGLLGLYLEMHEMGWADLAQAGVRLTHSIHHRLQEQQPGAVIGRYLTVMYGPTAHCSSNCGPHNAFSFAFGFIEATPAVAAAAWRDGNWFARILLVATIGLVLTFAITNLTEKGRDLAERVFGAAFAFIIGPVVVAAVFWVLLHVLMLLTAIIGEVLSGAVLVITTFSGVWTVWKKTIEVLKRADELDEKAVPFVKKLFGGRAPPPPAPPAAPPSAAPPPAAPPPAAPPPAV